MPRADHLSMCPDPDHHALMTISGKIYLVGNAGAEFAGQTPSGPSDIFVMSLLPSP